MKNYKKLVLSLAIILFFISFLSPNALCYDPIRDTTFSPEMGDKFTWRATGGDKYELTIDNIYYNNSYFQIDATLRIYNANTSTWEDIIINDFYVSFQRITTLRRRWFFVAANGTKEIINYNMEYVINGFIVLIPKPLNLTLIGEYLMDAYYNDYQTSGRTLTLYSPGSVKHEIIFNSDGIATKIVATVSGLTAMVLTLETEEKIIPFGFYSLIFASVSILALTFLIKRKIK